jgi:hypothetical protein
MPVRHPAPRRPRVSTTGTLLLAALVLGACAPGGRLSLTSRRARTLAARSTAEPVTTAASANALAATSRSSSRLSRATLLRSSPSGTYILDVLNAQQFEVVRWPERVEAPIRVWIADGSAVAGWQPTFPAVVRDAFAVWCGLGVPLRATFVSDSAQADVRIGWVEHFGEDVSGRTTWQYDDAGVIRSGRMTLSTRRADGALRSEPQLRAIALHEVGHTLGMQHAQDDPTSIMAPRVDAFELSPADKATVRLLYSLPAGKMQ